MPTYCAPTLNRRRVLACAGLALPWLASRPALAQDAPLKLCQSTALSGPLGDLGTALHLGAKAAFGAINAKGGIQGAKSCCRRWMTAMRCRVLWPTWTPFWPTMTALPCSTAWAHPWSMP